MIIDAYTKPLEAILIDAGISLTHIPTALKMSGHEVRETYSQWRASLYQGKYVFGEGETPREAIISLAKKLK